jgi:hypothetical protein
MQQNGRDNQKAAPGSFGRAQTTSFSYGRFPKPLPSDAPLASASAAAYQCRRPHPEREGFGKFSFTWGRKAGSRKW